MPCTAVGRKPQRPGRRHRRHQCTAVGVAGRTKEGGDLCEEKCSALASDSLEQKGSAPGSGALCRVLQRANLQRPISPDAILNAHVGPHAAACGKAAELAHVRLRRARRSACRADLPPRPQIYLTPADLSAAPPPQIYPTSSYDTFEEVVDEFLKEPEVACKPPEAAALAVAGAVEFNRCAMTNINWIVDGPGLEKNHNFK
eukprot:364263-Chlamydomonas_euryale.AAC.15